MSLPATDLAPSAAPAPSLEVQLSRHAVVMILASGAAVATGWHSLLALAAVTSFGFLLRHRRPVPSSPLGGVGWADALTGVRLLLLTLAVASMSEAPTAWVLFAFTANVALDVVDGFVARRLGQSSTFGSVFDREVDALFVLVAYLYLRPDGWLGAALWLAGILPYAYRLLASAAPVPVGAAYRERSAAVLAGLNFVMLLAAVAIPLHSSRILILSVVVVAASFAGSFCGLYRHARSFP